MTTQDNNSNSGDSRERQQSQGWHSDNDDRTVGLNQKGDNFDSQNKSRNDSHDQSSAYNKSEENNHYNPSKPTRDPANQQFDSQDEDSWKTDASTPEVGKQYRENNEINNPQDSDNSRINFNSDAMDDDDTTEEHFGDEPDNEDSLLDDADDAQTNA